MMRAGIAFSVVAAFLAAGCPKDPQTKPPERNGGGGEPRQDPGPGLRNLARDLEATVLENYMQLTLGNLDAYVDGLARSHEVALIGTAADQVVLSESPSAAGADRRLFRDAEPSVYSKMLEVHLSDDGGVGWIFDEVSYRVPYRGREASIPVRVTAGFVRSIDRWVLVCEHMSYALPSDELVRMAKDGHLNGPRPIDDRGAKVQLDQLLDKTVRRFHNGDAKMRARVLADDADALVLYPDPRHEFHGTAVSDAPALAEVFGVGGRVEVVGRRISVARTGKVAWMIANLRVDTEVDDEPVRFGLRGSYLFELRGEFGWEIVQAHVSAPVSEAELARRVFGPAGTPGVGLTGAGP